MIHLDHFLWLSATLLTFASTLHFLEERSFLSQLALRKSRIRMCLWTQGAALIFCWSAVALHFQNFFAIEGAPVDHAGPSFLIGLGFLLIFVQRIFVYKKIQAPLCGGSDSILALACFCLMLSFLLKAADAASSVVKIPILYLVAGYVKIRSSDWKAGHVIQDLFSSDHYPTGSTLKWIADRARISKALSLVIAIFEVGFLLPFFSLSSLKFFLIAGFLFHLGNSIFLGLHRFFWAWLACYPALAYFFVTLHGAMFTK